MIETLRSAQTYKTMALGFWRLMAISSLLLWVIVLFDDRISAVFDETRTPYRNVQLHSATMTERGLSIYASFTKLRCEFIRLRVLGRGEDTVRFLPWVDLQPPPNGDSDRSQGSHTLHILVDTLGVVDNSIEIRTRHACMVRGESGQHYRELVDNVFLTIERKDIKR